MIPFLCFLSLAFLIGSVPFAYLFVKRMAGVDIRTVGSGNPGATNAARVLGKPMGILVLALDILKGVVAALLPWIAPVELVNIFGHKGLALAFGLAAFLGHCYTPFLRFKGGKGVATALGVYLVIAPAASLITFAICAAIILATRLVSLASITGAVLLPLLIAVFAWRPDPPHLGRGNWVVLGITTILSAWVILRHRANIRRLLEGKEKKI